jgi:hypothetical protein
MSAMRTSLQMTTCSDRSYTCLDDAASCVYVRVEGEGAAAVHAQHVLEVVVVVLCWARSSCCRTGDSVNVIDAMLYVSTGLTQSLCDAN